MKFISRSWQIHYSNIKEYIQIKEMLTKMGYNVENSCSDKGYLYGHPSSNIAAWAWYSPNRKDKYKAKNLIKKDIKQYEIY